MRFFDYLPVSINWSVALLIAISAASAEVVAVPSVGWKLQKAISKSQAGDTLILESGRYIGKFTVPPGVTLQSKKLHKAKIVGNGADRVVILTNGSSISGLDVSGGRVGVYSEGIDNSIRDCLIHNNRQTGAVILLALPEIEDNVVFRNGGSGLQLWDIQANKMNAIRHNTIVFNRNHGVSIGGKSEILVENNIIAYNQKLTLKVDPLAKVTQEFNVYYYNIEINMALPENNYSFDPQFASLEFNDFNLQESSRCFNNGRFGSDIGVRTNNNN
jgi:hypothetical protein